MIAANELKLNPEFMIVAEPTQSKLIKRQKGILKFRLVAQGIAAHSGEKKKYKFRSFSDSIPKGYPHTGVSAIENLMDVLQDLRTEKWDGNQELGDTTLNIGTIKGGEAVRQKKKKLRLKL